jgi:hypothetical protein
MQTVPIMFDSVTTKADELRDLFGVRALREAEARLDEAMLWRDHKATVLYADVCGELRRDETKPAESRPRRLTPSWLALARLGTRNAHGSRPLLA